MTFQCSPWSIMEWFSLASCLFGRDLTSRKDFVHIIWHFACVLYEDACFCLFCSFRNRAHGLHVPPSHVASLWRWGGRPRGEVGCLTSLLFLLGPQCLLSHLLFRLAHWLQGTPLLKGNSPHCFSEAASPHSGLRTAKVQCGLVFWLLMFDSRNALVCTDVSGSPLLLGVFPASPCLHSSSSQQDVGSTSGGRSPLFLDIWRYSVFR